MTQESLWTVWLRREPDGWLLKLGPVAVARYLWFDKKSWFCYACGRVAVWR